MAEDTRLKTITVTPSARPDRIALLWITDEHDDDEAKPVFALTRADLQALIDAATKALAVMDAAAAPPPQTGGR
jgi:hypothetical protein